MSFGRDHYNPSRGVKSSGFAVIYVRKAGKDHMDGSVQRPLRTISAALEKLPASSNTGIVIDVGPGVWHEDITIPPVRFYGAKKFSRTISTRLGLGGNDSDFLGLLIRGAQGSFSDIGFRTESKRFAPKVVSEADGNSNDIFFSPATKITGTITSPPSACYELACLELDVGKAEYVYSLSTYGTLASIKGVVFKNRFSPICIESFSDIKLEGCYIDSTREIQLRSKSILRTKDCEGVKIKSSDESLHIKL